MTQRLLVTGGTGLLGRAVVPLLKERGHDVVLTSGRATFDLSKDYTKLALGGIDQVVHLAFPGSQGIRTTQAGMTKLVDSQLRMDLNVLRAAALHKTRVLAIGAVCAYPEHVALPTEEGQLWAGRPEYWNEPYGQAKRMLLSLLDCYHRELRVPYTYLLLDNLYGPGDTTQHVIPANIQRCVRATVTGAPTILAWGRPETSREFLYVEDAARAVALAVDAAPTLRPVNICTGVETTMADLLAQIGALTGCTSTVQWDTAKPTGQARRRFCRERALTTLGWYPLIPLSEGLRRTVAWWKGQL